MSSYVPYTQKVFSLNVSEANYGSVNERIAFSKAIFDYMVETMGMPMVVSGQTGASTSCSATWYQATFTPNVSNLKTFEIATSASSSSSTLTFRPGNEGDFTLGFDAGQKCCQSSTKLQVYLRWIKAGNCWFLGFAPHTLSSSYGAWINSAVVPVRKVSDPDTIVGYGLVTQDTSYIYKSVFYANTSKDSNKTKVYRSYISELLPENTENPVAMLPLHMNAKDYYFEGVYVGNVSGNVSQETTITTNKGTFLVAQRYGDSASAIYPSLLFDITEAIAAEGV